MVFRRSHLWLFLIADTMASLANGQRWKKQAVEDLRELTGASPLRSGIIDTRGRDCEALSLIHPGPEF